jgi:hypothetical protein
VVLTLPTLATAWVLGHAHGFDDDVAARWADRSCRRVQGGCAGRDGPEPVDQRRSVEGFILVPEDAAADGTVTSVDQLKDRRNTVAIVAGEPILAGPLKIVAERHRSALVRKAMTIGA